MLGENLGNKCKTKQNKNHMLLSAYVKFQALIHLNLQARKHAVNWFISYILRFSHQILLYEKAFRILLRKIREAKRVSHT